MFGQLLLDVLILAGDAALTGSLLSVFKQLRNTKTAQSMSLLTLSAIVFARVLHGMAFPVFDLHYWPNHLPMALYFIMDVCNAALGIFVIYFFLIYFRKSYENEKDDFGSIVLRLVNKDSIMARWILFYGSIFCVAIMWNYVSRSYHYDKVIGFFCSYYETIAFFALLPQLWMFHRDKVVSECLGNFIVYTAAHRLCTLSFWLCFPLVHAHRHLDNRAVLMSSEILNLLILSDFLYYYVRAKMSGQKDIIIGDSVV